MIIIITCKLLEIHKDLFPVTSPDYTYSLDIVLEIVNFDVLSISITIGSILIELNTSRFSTFNFHYLN